MIKGSDKNLRLCILISFLTALAVFGGFIIAGRGAFTVRDDFNAQQIPFTVALHDELRDGGIGGWSWCTDLGGSTLQCFGFYELGSFFFWLSTLFGAGAIPYVMGFIYILKYIVAAVTAYLYLRRFIKGSGAVIACSLIYAFSGFQATNLMFYHFHDAVAFFPLLLFGLEEFMEKEDRRSFCLFSFAVFLNCITNYFFFIQEAVFLVIYFCFRFYDGTVKQLLIRALKCVAAGVTGIMMAGVLFIPSMAYILQSARASQAPTLSTLFYDTRGVLFILKGMLLPADTMQDHSILIHENWQSTSCFLPLFGLAPAIAYISEKRGWLSRLVTLLLALSFSPLLSAGFILFKETYQRWWYMMVLMLVLAGGLALDNARSPGLVKCTVAYLVVVILFYLIICNVEWSVYENVVYNKPRFFIYTCISAAGCIALLAVDRIGSERLLVVLTALFCALSTFVTLYFYRSDATPTPEYMRDFRQAVSMRDASAGLDDQYRLDVNNDNLHTMVARRAGLSGFISTRCNGISAFEELFDYYSTNNGIDKGDIPGLTKLLAGRYELSREEREGECAARFSSGDGDIFIYEKEHVCPIGFAMDRYIYRSDLLNIDRDKRGLALLQAAVVEDGFEGEADFVRILPGEMMLESDPDFYADRAAEEAVRDFERSGKGFKCTGSYERDRYVYFSVPNDAGWKAYIDGERADIVDSGGMMLLKVPAGEHSIEFRYFTPFLKHGILAALVSWIFFLMVAATHVLEKRIRG